MTKPTGESRAGKSTGSAYQPECGHFAYLDFTPQAGHEQAGRRPALFLSPQSYNIRTGLAFVCPVTSKIKGNPFEVLIPRGARIEGVILSNHLRSVDWIARNAEFHSIAPNDTVLEVLAKIEAILQISFDP